MTVDLAALPNKTTETLADTDQILLNSGGSAADVTVGVLTGHVQAAMQPALDTLGDAAAAASDAAGAVAGDLATLESDLASAAVDKGDAKVATAAAPGGLWTTVRGFIATLLGPDGASMVGNTPAGTIAATTVQGAINEIVSDLAAPSGSSLVGDISAGAGAVPTTQQAINRERVNVTRYATLQQALDTGKDVYIPSGIDVVTPPVTLTTAGQTIYGKGKRSTISPSVPGNHLFQVQADYVTISGVRLLGIDSSAAGTNFAITTSSVTPANHLTIDNVRITGLTGGVGFTNAIKFDDNCSHGTVKNCVIERLWGNASGKGYGVLAGDVIGCKVTDNRMFASSGRGRHGVYFSAGCSDSAANGNYLSGFDFEGISQYSTGVQPACSRNIYSKNTLVGCAASTNPFSGAIGIYQHSFGCIVSGNTITASGQRGITIDGSGVTDCANTSVYGNTVSFSKTNGINLTSTVRCSVENNLIHESSTSAADSFANISLRADGATACNDTSIVGNICSGPAYPRAAISLDPGNGGPSLLKLKGNSLRPGLSYTLELNGVTGVEIDGRLQFRLPVGGYGPIAAGASFVGPLTLTGADQGDICTVTYDQNTDGCVLYAYCSGTGVGVLTIANLSGAPKTIPAGTLRVDVWRRSAPM